MDEKVWDRRHFQLARVARVGDPIEGGWRWGTTEASLCLSRMQMPLLVQLSALLWIGHAGGQEERPGTPIANQTVVQPEGGPPAQLCAHER